MLRFSDSAASAMPGLWYASAGMGIAVKTTMAGALGFAVLVPVSPVTAQDAEQVAMVRVRLTTEPTLALGCARIGMVSDDSVKDLRRKILRVGGNTGVLSFRADDLSRIDAEVYQCPPARDPNVPIPPPPPGIPPPPPSGPVR